MKKRITIAALLVAGTAFANAEGINPTSYDVTFGDNGTSDLTSQRSHIVFNGDNSSLDSWLLEFTITKFGTGGNTPVFATNFGTAGGSNERYGLSVYSWYDGSGLTLGLDGNHVAGTDGVSPSKLDLDLSNSVTLRIAYDATSNVAYLYSADIRSGTDLTTMILENDQTLYGTNAGNGSDVSGKAAFWTDGGATHFTLGKVYDLSSIAGNSALVEQYVKTLTIPEPSTFGLLAGLGALALVGTRRRRR